jgi:polysaccharide deacetylase family protein (PEP-CTERM system associated)
VTVAANVLTIDVEDWYHHGLGDADAAAARFEKRVERNVARLLELLDAHRARATFFVLGEIAASLPGLVREILARGHELGSHGFHHRPVRSLLQREFREELARSFGVLSEIAGEPIAGYRAPYFSIKADVRWPLEAVARAGFRYDSSVLPIDRPPGLEVVSPRTPHQVSGELWEVPVAVNRYFIWNLPLLGGFALRLLPLPFLLRRLDEFNGEFGPAVVHLHPWEIDAAGPELDSVPAVVRGFKRWGRPGLEAKLEQLLAARRFGAIAEVFPEVVGAAPRT